MEYTSFNLSAPVVRRRPKNLIFGGIVGICIIFSIVCLFSGGNNLKGSSPMRMSSASVQVTDFQARSRMVRNLLAIRGGDDADMEVDDVVEEISTTKPDPEAAQAAKLKGNLQYEDQNFDKAVMHYTEAIQLDPTNPTYLNNRAAAYMAQKNLDEAEKDVRMALKVERAKESNLRDGKSLARSLNRLGTILHKRGNYTAAVKCYRESIVEFTLPETSLKLRDSEMAKKEQDKLAYLDPTKSAEAKERGNKLFRDCEFPEALKEYTEAIKRNPEDAKCWSNRAACYQKLYELRLGIKDAEKAVELDPKYVKGWSRLGQMYFGTKEVPKAHRAFTKMLELDPVNADAKKGIAMCENAIQSQQGPTDQAEVQRRVERDPEAMEILRDPAMQEVLRSMQSNPASAQKYMNDPMVARKIQKLVDVGVIQTKSGPGGR